MKVNVDVDAERSRLGRLTMVGADGQRYGPVEVCATADSAAAEAAGNPTCDPLRPGGHAPFGAYRLKEVKPVAPELLDELGDHALVFEPLSGEGRRAESHGRLVLLVHGGRPGEDGRLRPTDAGLRVTPETLGRLVAAAKRGEQVDLDVQEAPLGFWERLFGSRRAPSREDFSGPAWGATDSAGASASSGSGPSRGGAFEAGGGSFGGAGASSSWAESTREGATASYTPAQAATALGVAGLATVAATDMSSMQAASAEGSGSASASGAESGSSDTGGTQTTTSY